MRILLFSAAAAALAIGAQPAFAQDAADQTSAATSSNGTSFLGFRAEIQAGGDRFMSQGTHDDKVGFGGAVGFDGAIGDKIVIGPEFSYWRARGENVTPGFGGAPSITNRSRSSARASAPDTRLHRRCSYMASAAT